MLQESLYRLRGETQDAFNEAKALEGRWKELEREQREVYQVRLPIRLTFHNLIGTLAVHTSISANASPTCNNGARRSIRSTCLGFCAVVVDFTFAIS